MAHDWGKKYFSVGLSQLLTSAQGEVIAVLLI